jgi:hypothetical protein
LALPAARTDSRQFDEIEQMNVVSRVLSEAGKSSATGAIDEEKNEDGNKDASVGDLPVPAEEVEKEGETPAADETLEAAAEAASKTTDELSNTTDEVRAWPVSKFNESTRFSKQSLVWVFDLHRGVHKGLVTSPPAIEIAADKNQSSTSLFFGGLEVSIWGKL